MVRIVHATVFLVLWSSLVHAQQCKTDLTGVWEFSASSQNYSGTAEIHQSGTKFSGAFRFNNRTTGTIQSGQCPGSNNTELSFAIRMDHVVGRPSEDQITYLFVATSISTDGSNIIGGTMTRVDGAVSAKWSARRAAPRISAVVNAASGTSGQIAPGQLISIYGNAGAALGPNNGVALQVNQDGRVADSIGGVGVEFLPTRVFAPLTYVSPGQINAIVPYEVAGLSQAHIKVHFSGRSSEPFSVSISAAVPGIFTVNGSGTGLGAILNHDGNVNSAERREPRGGVVTLYLTGAGQTTPPGVSGRITMPAESEPLTPTPLASPTVHINGQPARVLFYGEAPGLVSGVVQINAEIPLASSSGIVPISVSINGVTSREGVTVAVQ